MCPLLSLSVSNCKIFLFLFYLGFYSLISELEEHFAAAVSTKLTSNWEARAAIFAIEDLNALPSTSKLDFLSSSCYLLSDYDGPISEK